MVALPILRGTKADTAGNFRVSWPINYEPVVTDTGISKGFLRAVPGVTLITDPALGADRGGFVWRGVHYRVMGSALVSINGVVVTTLGDVGDNGLPVSMDNSFDLLAIASNENLFYWSGSALKQVTDPDLGVVLDVKYIDGRFATTDGSNIVLTELNDPYSVDPLKYGSAEVSPDRIIGLIVIRDELFAVGTGTIENFRNVGGAGFPYQRNSGALIPKGAVGTHAYCDFIDTFAFVGNAPGEATSVWLAGGGDALPLGTPDVDRELAALTASELTLVELESRQEEGEQRLILHLPSKSLMFLNQASKGAGEMVWCQMNAGVGNDLPYPVRHLALTDSGWIGGTSDGRIGKLDYGVETLFGEERGWQFETLLVYNQAKGGIINCLELIGLTGAAPFGATPKAFLSISLDGLTWGQERAIETGRFGQREKRCQWRPARKFNNYCGLRFRGAGNGREAWARLEADIEGLAA